MKLPCSASVTVWRLFDMGGASLQGNLPREELMVSLQGSTGVCSQCQHFLPLLGCKASVLLQIHAKFPIEYLEKLG